MPDRSTTKASDKRPIVLFTTSLNESKLNRHVIGAIRLALQDRFDVEFLTPESLIQKPDLSGYALLLYVGSSLSEPVPLATIAAMARLADVPSVFLATDDPYEFDARYRANDFTIYLSNDRNAAAHFVERELVYHLPLAASLEDRRDITPFDQRKVGAFFCGYHYENRRRLITDLLNVPGYSRNDLVIMGGTWNIPGLYEISSDCDHDSLINTYGLVKYVLNIGRTYDIANVHRKIVSTTPGPRTFECALAGTPQIYFCNSLEIEEYFEPNKEILVVEGVDEAVEQMRWLRERPDVWLQIAHAAQKRTAAEHLYKHRLEKMLSILDDVGISFP